MVMVVRKVRRQPFRRSGELKQSFAPAMGRWATAVPEKLMEPGVHLLKLRTAQARQFSNDFLRAHTMETMAG